MMLKRLALAALLALAPQLAAAQMALIGPTPTSATENSDRLATTQWVNNFVGAGLPLASGKIWIGSAGNIAVAQTLTGDCTLSLSGVVTCTQAAGNFNVIGSLTVGGLLIDSTGVLTTNIAAPATPAAGTTRIYVDLTQKVLTFKNDAGLVGNAVVPLTCGANTFGNSISAAGVFGCAAVPTTALTGTLQAAQEPAHTGDVTNSAGSLALAYANVVPANKGGAGAITGALKANGSGTVTQAACADLSNATTYCSATQGQLPGIATNTAATAGNIGELISSTIVTGSAVSLTNGVAANMTSISLTTGDWDVVCDTYYNVTGTTNPQYLISSISTSTGSLNQTAGFFGGWANASTTPTLTTTVPFNTKAGPAQQLLSGTTTVFCVVQAGFTTSTVGVWGILRARRTH